MTARHLSTTAIVPFKRETSGHITVVASLAGKQARFLVDTGAGGTCIHSGLIEKYALSLGDETTEGGGVGSSSMSIATVAGHDLALADVDLSSFALIALDLTHVVAGLATEQVEAIDGVLGADVLHRKNAVIDYARGIILLSQ